MKTKGKLLKRMVAIILTIVMIISISPITEIEVKAAMSGICGDNLTWTLDEKGTLTISGYGEMYDYSGSNNDVT